MFVQYLERDKACLLGCWTCCQRVELQPLPALVHTITLLHVSLPALLLHCSRNNKLLENIALHEFYMNVQYNDPFALCTKRHLNFFPFFSGFVTENQLPHKIQYISWSPVGHKLVSKVNEALEWFCFVWLEDIYLPFVIILLGHFFDRPVCINLGCEQEWQNSFNLLNLICLCLNRRIHVLSYVMCFSSLASVLSRIDQHNCM